MKQYGDITKLSGHDLEPVDLIVGGSPCQDLSVAGKRAGLDGERSGLFLEMIRIIRQMRKETNGIYPRFALWENVPGAFSSNNGKDFGAVLGEFARLIEPESPNVPVPEEGWPKAGILLVSNGQIAWRTHDAQFWGKTIRDSRTGDVLQMGTPQRRRRISLVVDLGGQSAAEILFERKGVSGDFEQGGTPWKEIARGTGGGIENASGKLGVITMNPRPMSMVCSEDKCATLGADDYKEPQIICLNDQGGDVMSVSENKTASLRAEEHGHQPVICIQGNCIDQPAVYDSSVRHGYKEFENVSETVTASYGTGGNNTPFVVCGTYQNTGQGWWNESEIGATIRTPCGGDSNKANLVVQKTSVSIGNGQTNNISMSDKANALDTMHDQQCVMCLDEGFFSTEEERASSLLARDYKAAKIVNTPTVRRLTPLECERLQGYPNRWTDIPGASDSARYKALGNSIALPFWEHLAKRFAQYGKVKSIGSLFDGIGGFPLVFKRAGSETKWTSEIEPFCEKVVKYHLEKGDL